MKFVQFLYVIRYFYNYSNKFLYNFVKIYNKIVLLQYKKLTANLIPPVEDTS